MRLTPLQQQRMRDLLGESTQRVWIEKGKLQQIVDLEHRLHFPVSFALEVQLYDETGKKASGSYRGIGEIVDRDRRVVVVVGSESQAFRPEYTADREATPESLKNLDKFIEGFKAGVSGSKKFVDDDAWRSGYSEGADVRKAKPKEAKEAAAAYKHEKRVTKLDWD